jgi:hypothetical protein
MFVKRERMIARRVASAKEHAMASRKKDGDTGKRDGRADEDLETSERKSEPLARKKGRQSEFAVSRGGMNQESRQHNKPRPEN